MNKKLGSAIILSLMLFASNCRLRAQDVQIEGTIQVTSKPDDYSLWKTKRIMMQLKREHNTIIINSLLQPASVVGSVFFGTLAVLYTICIASGGGDRHAGKDLVDTIDAFIRLVKAPFTLQYEKNKTRDRIAMLNEEMAKRSIQIS